MSEPVTPLLQPMPLRVVLDEAMRWVRRTFRQLYLPFAVPAALLNTLVALPQPLLGTMAEVPEVGFGFFGSLFGLVLVFYALLALLYAAMGVAAVDAVAGRQPRPAAAFRFVLRPRALGTLFLTGFWVMLSYLCCVLPSLYVMPLLALTVPAMVEEGRWGMDAVRRSAVLTHYNPRRHVLDNPITRVFLLLVVAFVLSSLLGLAVQMPFQLLYLWLLFRGQGVEGEEETLTAALWTQVPGTTLAAFATTVVALYASFGLALLFFDARRRKEGLDLETAIDEAERRRSGEATAP